MNICSCMQCCPVPSDLQLIDAERVARVRQAMAPDEVMDRTAETFRVLGDPTRARIIFSLLHEELCVGDLASLMGISSSAVSHQLRILRNLRLVRHRKAGKVVYYALDDDHIRNLFEEAFRHVREEM